MRKTFLLFVFLYFVGTYSAHAQSSGNLNVTEPQSLHELGIPFAQDDFFLANYSENTILIYVNGKEVCTVPAYSYRRAAFYVASRTRVEAYTNALTDRGTKRVKMTRQAVVIRKKNGGTDSGWMFSK